MDLFLGDGPILEFPADLETGAELAPSLEAVDSPTRILVSPIP